MKVGSPVSWVLVKLFNGFFTGHSIIDTNTHNAQQGWTFNRMSNYNRLKTWYVPGAVTLYAPTQIHKLFGWWEAMYNNATYVINFQYFLDFKSGPSVKSGWRTDLDLHSCNKMKEWMTIFVCTQGTCSFNWRVENDTYIYIWINVP